jgi:hypothetical protein
VKSHAESGIGIHLYHTSVSFSTVIPRTTYGNHHVGKGNNNNEVQMYRCRTKNWELVPLGGGDAQQLWAGDGVG